MIATIQDLAYLGAAILFILSLRALSSPETARTGNVQGMAGMGLAVFATLLPALLDGWTGEDLLGRLAPVFGGVVVGGGVGLAIARRIRMTDLPQLVAAFHSLVGLAAVLVAVAARLSPAALGLTVDPQGHLAMGSLVEMGLGAVIGSVTFTGSIVAFAKLQGLVSSAPLSFSGQHALNAVLGLATLTLVAHFALSGGEITPFLLAIAGSLLLGFLLILPIGGADMPVVVSMLNSYSGWAACGIGFTLHNPLLIVTGALVGASGAILSHVMCKGMNRSILSVILGGFGGDVTAASGGAGREQRPVKQGSPEDAAFILKNANSVVIVPGYGMAVAQAQHALREMADVLKKEGITVRYAIHPVAGRMPGHMNVLLAEANVPYDEVLELDDINRDFSQTDVAFVIGANDVTNPAAKTDPTSPIFGMPILDVENARTVLFIKRSMAAGYAGVDNELFYRDHTMMLFGDAKKVVEGILKAGSAH
ncbi:MAG: NAD(P)(+) transhydrogenase (Re/Si-specific) subunit beta [Candidatus Sericytochromatia bacterium]|nr:NAD(P)(+) transhydrogenase (Re/Si-specific) subunit beta [Candidatus Sericytochromatia bacterium]